MAESGTGAGDRCRRATHVSVCACGPRHAIRLPRTAHEHAHPHAFAHASRVPVSGSVGGSDQRVAAGVSRPAWATRVRVCVCGPRPGLPRGPEFPVRPYLIQPYLREVFFRHAEEMPGLVQQGDADLFAQFLRAVHGPLQVLAEQENLREFGLAPHP